MRRAAVLAAFALSMLAAGGARAQIEATVNALVRPPLSDQLHFYYPHGFIHHRYHPAEAFDCTRDWPRLDAVVHSLPRYATLRLYGKGPACTLTGPLAVDRPLRLIGWMDDPDRDRDKDKDREKRPTILAAAGGPCIDVLPSGELVLQDLRIFSDDKGPKNDCVRSAGTALTLDGVEIGSPGTALRVDGGEVELRNAVIRGGGDHADVVLDQAQFVIADSEIRAHGDALEIRPPDHGVATISRTSLFTEGHDNAGLVLRSPRGDGASALVSLDRIAIREFSVGIVAEPHTRAVASQIAIFGSRDTGIDMNGSGFTLLQSVILHGRVGIHMHGYGPAPDLHAGEPRIEGNRIARVHEAGIAVEDGTPGAVRDNMIAAAHSRCIVGDGARGDIRESLNRCTNEDGERGFLAGLGPWFMELFHGNNHIIEPWLYADEAMPDRH